MNIHKPLLVLLVSNLLWACAGSGGGSRMGGMRDVLTGEEITKENVTNAYDAVSRLRPHFLQTRGTSYPVIYLDNIRYGGVTSLREIPVANIHQIEFINASDATTRFGTGHTGGVIMVTTKR
ncbi:MAG: Plug domain-containing protein [Ignavibacteriales bacterium]|nr:Plug domain-containing protein [Ignavibacteriales bacterium]